MKIFAIIFTFYLTALSLVPCVDSIGISENKNSISFNQEQNHEDQHRDMCSPFCACNCCRVISDIAFNVHLIRIGGNHSIPEIQFPAYNDSLISLHNKNIWQPPKITA